MASYLKLFYDSEWTRRLTFSKSDPTIQSEASYTKNNKINHSELNCDYYIGVVSALLTLPSIFTTSTKVLILGLGGGCLASHILKHYPKVEITAIEISKSVISIAREFFELPNSDRLKVIQQDGLEFLKETSESYDAVILDVNSSDKSTALICPAPAFITEEQVAKYWETFDLN